VKSIIKSFNTAVAILIVFVAAFIIFTFVGFFRCLIWAKNYICLGLLCSFIFAADNYNDAVKEINNEKVIGGIFGRVSETVTTNWITYGRDFTSLSPNIKYQVGLVSTNIVVTFIYRGKSYTKILEKFTEKSPSIINILDE
jgi:hypothetical protein